MKLALFGAVFLAFPVIATRSTSSWRPGFTERAQGVPAVPHRHADPVPARRDARLFRRHAARDELLPVDAADRRARWNPAQARGQRVPLADHDADPRLRDLLPAARAADAACAAPGCHRRPLKASAACHPHRLHRRRRAVAARSVQPDLAGDTDDRALRAVDLGGGAPPRNATPLRPAGKPPEKNPSASRRDDPETSLSTTSG